MRNRHSAELLIIGSLIFASGVSAGTIYEDIKATLRSDYTVKVGDSKLNLKNNYPIVYNNTTYVPLRIIGEAVGKQVKWDSKSKVISLTAQDKKPYNITFGNKTAIPNETYGREFAYRRTDINVTSSDFIVKNSSNNNNLYFNIIINDISDQFGPYNIEVVDMSNGDSVTIQREMVVINKEHSIKIPIKGVDSLIVKISASKFGGDGVATIMDVCVD